MFSLQPILWKHSISFFQYLVTIINSKLTSHMRPNRALTPQSSHATSYNNLPSQQPQSSKKYYTREQVSQILRSTLETKLTKIYKDAQEKQRIIKHLNQQLSHNDKQMQALKQDFCNYRNSMSNQDQHYWQMVHSVERIVNDKIQQYWANAKNQLEKIRKENIKKIKNICQAHQQNINRKLSEIRVKCDQHMDCYKKKNNGYWQKIKQTLNKLNSRIMGNYDNISNLSNKIEGLEERMHGDEKMRKQLQKCKRSVQMLLDLKKSVNSSYQNYQHILKLQEEINQKCLFSSQNTLTSGYCFKCGANLEANKVRKQVKKNSLKEKKDSIVMLEYSLEDDTISKKQPFVTNDDINNHFFNTETLKQINQPRQYTSPLKNNLEETDNHTNPNQNLQQFESYFNLTLEQQSTKVKTSTSPQKYINTSHNHNYSSSFLNFSLEARKQMFESIRPRLIETIETKNLKKPLRVYLDNINYLKNEEGNYLFDLKGNMFKCCNKDFKQLENQGLIVKANYKPNVNLI